MANLAEKTDNISIDDYLSGEIISEIKHEYVQGQVYAMAGAKLRHNIISTNLSALLWHHLRGKPCFPFGSDMMLKTSEKSYRYPDLMVVCDTEVLDNPQIQTTPVLIIEILSKSTRQKDKGEKRLEYLALPSLQEYVLIEQDFAEIEVQRKSKHWQSSYYFLGQDVFFESINISLPVEEIYERVDNDNMRLFLQQTNPTTSN